MGAYRNAFLRVTVELAWMIDAMRLLRCASVLDSSGMCTEVKES
jgi:hypothetical protein